MNIERISKNKLQGYYFMPENAEELKNGIVITFGGSEGSSWINMGKSIADLGYRVLSLYYFGRPHLSRGLDLIDLNFFQDVLSFINKLENKSPITLVGASRGAEMSLILTNYFPEINNLILFSPSSFVFPGNKNRSAWTYNGNEIQATHFSTKSKIKKIIHRNLSWPDFFRKEFKTNKQAISIDISNFSGNLLTFSGSDDQVWHSAEMARLIEKASIKAQSVSCYEFEEAGHIFSNGLNNGGTFDGNAFAFYKSIQIMDKSLETWHSN